MTAFEKKPSEIYVAQQESLSESFIIQNKPALPAILNNSKEPEEKKNDVEEHNLNLTDSMLFKKIKCLIGQEQVNMLSTEKNVNSEESLKLCDNLTSKTSPRKIEIIEIDEKVIFVAIYL